SCPSFDELVTQVQHEISQHHCICVRDTNQKGISAVAAPILNYAGQLTGVLTALGASGGFNTSLAGPIAMAVCQQAQRISQQLGYTAPLTGSQQCKQKWPRIQPEP